MDLLTLILLPAVSVRSWANGVTDVPIGAPTVMLLPAVRAKLPPLGTSLLRIELTMLMLVVAASETLVHAPGVPGFILGSRYNVAGESPEATVPPPSETGETT